MCTRSSSRHPAASASACQAPIELHRCNQSGTCARSGTSMHAADDAVATRHQLHQAYMEPQPTLQRDASPAGAGPHHAALSLRRHARSGLGDDCGELDKCTVHTSMRSDAPGCPSDAMQPEASRMMPLLGSDCSTCA